MLTLQLMVLLLMLDDNMIKVMYAHNISKGVENCVKYLWHDRISSAARQIYVGNSDPTTHTQQYRIN